MALDKIIKKCIKKKKKQEYPGETLKKKNHEGEHTLKLIIKSLII